MGFGFGSWNLKGLTSSRAFDCKRGEEENYHHYKKIFNLEDKGICKVTFLEVLVEKSWKGKEKGMADNHGLEGSQPVDLSKHPSGIVPTLQ